jgi:DNA-binding CsgD family transcriptional regulator
LVGKTYEGAVTNGDWSRTSACLARQFDSRSARIGTRVGVGGEPLLDPDCSYSFGDPEGGAFGNVDQLIQEALPLPRGVPLLRGHAGPSVVRSSGMTGHLMLLVTEPAIDRPAFLGIVRDEKQAPFSFADVEAFLAAGQHVRRAIQMASRRSAAMSERPSSQLDVLGYAVFLFDIDGRVTRTNALADALAVAGDGLVLRGGRLRLQSDLAFDAALAAISTAAAQSGFHDRPAPIFFTIRQTAEARRLSAMLAMTPREWAEGRQLAMLVVSDPTRHASPPSIALRNEFGLTEAEIRFLLSFLKSFSVRSAAQAVGIRWETARRHLKSIFAKTETHSQAELTQMLLLHPASVFGPLLDEHRN